MNSPEFSVTILYSLQTISDHHANKLLATNIVTIVIITGIQIVSIYELCR